MEDMNLKVHVENGRARLVDDKTDLPDGDFDLTPVNPLDEYSSEERTQLEAVLEERASRALAGGEGVDADEVIARLKARAGR